MRLSPERDMTFPHSYSVESISNLPGNGRLEIPLEDIPRPKSRAEHDGLWVLIRPASGKSWVGIFAFGYEEPPATSRIVTPDPDRVCIISPGAAYIVQADDPSTYQQIPVLPVLDVRSIPEHRLLVLADFTRMAAFGRNGILWTSPQVRWDELKILNVTAERIEGVGYDPTNLGGSAQSHFAVETKTGRSLFPSPVSTDGRSLWKNE
jgi:hypothetical protein